MGVSGRGFGLENFILLVTLNLQIIFLQCVDFKFLPKFGNVSNELLKCTKNLWFIFVKLNFQSEIRNYLEL